MDGRYRILQFVEWKICMFLQKPRYLQAMFNIVTHNLGNV